MTARRCLAIAAAGVLGCATTPAPGTSSDTTTPVARTSTAPMANDSTAAGLVPAGFGSLRQDQVTIILEPRDLLVRAMPLDESVIRLLSPDSYRSLHDILASRRAELDRMAAMHQLRSRDVWYLSLHGLSAEVRFDPRDLSITSAGREFRPVDILPLTAGFGEHRLQARSTQTALVLFEDGIDLTQPLTVSFGTERDASSWGAIVRVLERERTAVRGRANRS